MRTTSQLPGHTEPGTACGHEHDETLYLWVVGDPFAWVKGRIAGADAIKGTFTFNGDGDPDPCQAAVHFSAHYSPLTSGRSHGR